MEDWLLFLGAWNWGHLPLHFESLQLWPPGSSREGAPGGTSPPKHPLQLSPWTLERESARLALGPRGEPVFSHMVATRKCPWKPACKPGAAELDFGPGNEIEMVAHIYVHLGSIPLFCQKPQGPWVLRNVPQCRRGRKPGPSALPWPGVHGLSRAAPGTEGWDLKLACPQPPASPSPLLAPLSVLGLESPSVPLHGRTEKSSHWAMPGSLRTP